jgi:putative Mn2+ efflux pump MntP
MDFLTIFLLAVGLSLDSFSVSIAIGFSERKGRDLLRSALLAGAFFGGFQMLMPLFGFLLGSTLRDFVTGIDHWMAFILLGLIGLKMITESFGKEGKKPVSTSIFSFFLLAIATSIDALAAGIGFAFIQIPLFWTLLAIGLTDFSFSFLGVLFGERLGKKFGRGAELAGGIVLVSLGAKILIEHLFF